MQASLESIVKRSSPKAKQDIKNRMCLFLESSPTFTSRWNVLEPTVQEEVLCLFVKKGTFCYELVTCTAAGMLSEFPTINMFTSVLRNDINIDQEAYDNAKKLWDTVGLRTVNEWMMIYNMADVVQLSSCFDEYFESLEEQMGMNPRRFTSVNSLSKATALKREEIILNSPQDCPLSRSLENGIRGGYSDACKRVVVDGRAFGDLQIFTSVAPQNKDGVSDGQEVIKSVNMTCFLFDQAAQYSTQITKNLTTGNYKQISHHTPPDKTYKDFNEWLKNDALEGDVGYYLEVIVEPPADRNSLQGQAVEEFNPLLSRESVNPAWLSSYQLLKLRKARQPTKKVEGGFKKLRFVDTTLSKYATQKTGATGHLLHYCIKHLGFKIVKVLALYRYSQKPILKNYINTLRIKRNECKKRGDTVGDDATKRAMNGTYGALGCNPKNPKIVIVHDYEKEAADFSKKYPKEKDSFNRWIVGTKQIRACYQAKYDAKKNSLKEQLGMGIITEAEYKTAKEMHHRALISKCHEHEKFVKSGHNERITDVKKTVDNIEKFRSAGIKEVYVNPNKDSSMSVLLTKSCRDYSLGTRHVLTDVLQRAKRDISYFMLRLRMVFHPDTRALGLVTYMNKHKMEEIQLELGATDTDSCKYHVTALSHRDSRIPHDQFADDIRAIVYHEIKDLLDTSNPHFKKYGIWDPKTEKQFGTFGVDEIDGVPSIEEKNQLMVAFYTGSKKYYELSFDKKTKMKHAGDRFFVLFVSFY